MPDMDIMGPKEAMLSWTLETNAKKFKPAHPNVHPYVVGVAANGVNNACI